MDYWINNNLVEFIEQDKGELTLRQKFIVCIVNSYTRVGKKCEISHDGFAKELVCSKSTVRRELDDLKKKRVIKVFYPPNQQQDQVPCITWFHNDIKSIIDDLKAVSKLSTGPISEAISKMNTNNKNIGDSESSLKDSSSQTIEDTFAFLNFLKEDCKTK